jgi:PadR family transcriptional regulator PadR
MPSKSDVWQGTLALMILKTLETLGPFHGYGVARRIEQTSGDRLSINYGTIYPALLKLEQEGYIASDWGVSENNRKAKFYRLTRAGRKQLDKEAREWDQTTSILARFLTRGGESARGRFARGSCGPAVCSLEGGAIASSPRKSRATFACTPTTTSRAV